MNNFENKAVMAKNIKRYMAEKGVKAIDICETLGFPMATFSDWIREKTYPRIDKIEKMAAYFGVQKSDLIEENPSANSFAKQKLLAIVENFSDEQILKLLPLVEEAKKLV